MAPLRESKDTYDRSKAKPNAGMFSKGHKRTVGEKNPQWKGELAGYTSIHGWIYLRLGKPRKCWICASETSKRYDWANISKDYRRDLSDWIRLCRSCHIRYDHGSLQLPPISQWHR